MKIKFFLNDEDEKFVRDSIRDLLAHGETEAIENGGLGVKIERVGEFALFDIYRIVGRVEVKLKKGVRR